MYIDFYKEHFALGQESVTNAENIIIRGKVRISVLSDRVLRVEVDSKGQFTDEPTQCVWYRNFSSPKFRTVENGKIIKIITERAMFIYDLRAKKMLSVTLENGKTVTDYKKGNLKGTYRTLDMTRGAIPLEDGLISTEGVTMFDDSKSHILNKNGQIKERRATQKDEYYFAFGHSYRECINALYSLCGKVPLVPRYCLSNWWSRYKAYSQQEYIDLMTKFIDSKIPITVATVDMDWHWVDLSRFGDDAKYQFRIENGKFVRNLVEADGWTGYSWNTELFPDYKGFLQWLQDKNFKVTLNLPPAQGMRPFEVMYNEFAERMSINPATKLHIPFDITDKKYMEAYFDIVHR